METSKMQTFKSNWLTWIAAFFALLQLSFVFSPVAVHAAEVEYEPTEEEIDEVAEMLEFMYDEAFTLDHRGDLVSIDFDLIRAEYGDEQELAEFEELFKEYEAQQALANDPNAITTNNTWWSCFRSAIANYLGIGATHSVFSSIYAYIQQRSWRAAEALLKVAGGKVTIGALAAVLSYQAIRCGL